MQYRRRKQVSVRDNAEQERVVSANEGEQLELCQILANSSELDSFIVATISTDDLPPRATEITVCSRLFCTIQL